MHSFGFGFVACACACDGTVMELVMVMELDRECWGWRKVRAFVGFHGLVVGRLRERRGVGCRLTWSNSCKDRGTLGNKYCHVEGQVAL